MNTECNEIRDLIADSVTGTLAGGQAMHLDRHLQRCADCRRYAEALRHEDALLGRLAADVTMDMPDREERLLQVLDRGQFRHANHLTICKRIVRSPIAGLAAAVLIVTAVMVGMIYFNGTTLKAVELSEITKAMSEVPWMHVTLRGLQDDPHLSVEEWFGFGSKVYAYRNADGVVGFESFADHKRVTYTPGRNTISIIYMEDDPFYSMDLTSPALFLESLGKMCEQEGAETTVRMGDYQGRRVQIQEISYRANDEQQNTTLYVDPETRRLCAGKQVRADATGKVTVDANLDFDYPPAGPDSIYDLGAPRDARVVDMMPSASFSPVWEEYLRRKAELPKDYIAVIVHRRESLSGRVQMLDVEYKSGRRQRHERYYPHGEVIAELGPEYQEQLGSSIEPLLAWARRRYEDPRAGLWLQFDDGQYSMKIHRDIIGGWETPVPDIRVPMTLPQAWPSIPPTSNIIEDDHARENGLICVEALFQGQVTDDFGVVHPRRFLHYLDPAHDYLCRRQVMEWRPDADWQQDKHYLKGVDPNEVRGGTMLVCEITEVFQAPNGHWYPRVIIEKSRYADSGEDHRDLPMKVTDVKTIYLDVSPTFPEGIFDRNRLPGQ